jgi:hypothetical protein
MLRGSCRINPSFGFPGKNLPFQEFTMFDKILALTALSAMAIAIIYTALVH